MILLGKNINKNGGLVYCLMVYLFRFVVLKAETPQDLWHLYNLLQIGDKIFCETVRKIRPQGQAGNLQSQVFNFFDSL
jgi:hypothetical protein